MNEIEKYIVERLHSLEDEVEEKKDEISVLKEELEKVEKMKALMREYFKVSTYCDGSPYIDHHYKNEHFEEITKFIGLSMEGEDNGPET